MCRASTGAMLRAGHEVTLLRRAGGRRRPPLSHDGEAGAPSRCAPAPGQDTSASWIASMNRHLVSALRNGAPFDACLRAVLVVELGGDGVRAPARIPGILEVNAPLIEEQATHRRSLIDGAARAGGESRVPGRVGDRRRVARGRGVGAIGSPARPLNAVVEANGFDPTVFATVPAAGNRPFTIGFLGTLKPWHGIELLAEVFTGVRDRCPTRGCW